MLNKGLHIRIKCGKEMRSDIFDDNDSKTGQLNDSIILRISSSSWLFSTFLSSPSPSPFIALNIIILIFIHNYNRCVTSFLSQIYGMFMRNKEINRWNQLYIICDCAVNLNAINFTTYSRRVSFKFGCCFSGCIKNYLYCLPIVRMYMIL